MQQTNAQYFDLSHFSLLEITGKDAFSFLHSQLTCDLNDLDTNGWLFSAWCLPNGKVICTFFIFANDDSFFLILPSMLKDKITKRLTMYVLRSEVTITDVSDNYAMFGLAGNNLKDILDSTITKTMSVTGNLLLAADFSILQLWDKSPRYLLISKMEAVTELLNNITVTCISGERTTWSLMDIEAGIPWIINATSENFLPQMLNLDQMHGLSFKKGCYPGQEIIARLNYRGQLKKRLYLGSGETDITPGPGDRLKDKNTGTIVGEIIDAERNTSGGFEFLTVSESKYVNSKTLVLNDMSDACIKLKSLTYPA